MKKVVGWRRVTTSAAAGAVLATSPLVASASAPVELAPLYGTTAASAVEGSYLVVLDRGASAATADAVARPVRGQVTTTYDTVFQGFAAQLDDSALGELRRNPSVAFVSANQLVRVQDTQTPVTWGLDRVDQHALPLDDSLSYTSTGSGVTVYDIDTGIRSTHTEFTGRVAPGANFVGTEPIEGVEDCNGHGTHTAGIVGGTTYGVAKGVLIAPVRVIGCTGNGTTEDVVEGIDWVAANAVRPAVATMSISTDTIDPALDAAAQGLVDAGIAFTVSAGNGHTDACTYSPGHLPDVITVGATSMLDRKAGYSNFGPCVDVFAPGTEITSAWYSTDTATAVLDGTSMAAPHVAGTVARFLTYRTDATPSQLSDKIVKKSTKNVLVRVGAGSANRLLYAPPQA